MKTIVRKKIPLSLEIAPLVDIVFLLLIFFLLTSFVSMRSMQLDLPESSTANEATQSLLVAITQEGKIFLEGEQIDLEMLLFLLQSKLKDKKSTTVSIEADANVPLKIPVQVMDICRKAGAEGVSIATKKIGGN